MSKQLSHQELLDTKHPRHMEYTEHLKQVTRNGYALDDVPSELKTTSICLTAVTQYGYVLDSVPTKYRTEELCLAAVTQCGDALDYVPETLKTTSICLAAIRQNEYALKHVPNSILIQALKSSQELELLKQKLDDYSLSLTNSIIPIT